LQLRQQYNRISTEHNGDLNSVTRWAASAVNPFRADGCAAGSCAAAGHAETTSTRAMMRRQTELSAVQCSGGLMLSLSFVQIRSSAAEL
jgi:hypothetical protein